MKISREEVIETAKLARLELSEDELARMTRELDGILGYMEKLAALDVSGVEPTTHAVPLDLVLRRDELGAHLDREQALADAPQRHGEFFEVPKIIEAE